MSLASAESKPAAGPRSSVQVASAAPTGSSGGIGGSSSATCSDRNRKKEQGGLRPRAWGAAAETTKTQVSAARARRKSPPPAAIPAQANRTTPLRASRRPFGAAREHSRSPARKRPQQGERRAGRQSRPTARACSTAQAPDGAPSGRLREPLRLLGLRQTTEINGRQGNERVHPFRPPLSLYRRPLMRTGPWQCFCISCPKAAGAAFRYGPNLAPARGVTLDWRAGRAGESRAVAVSHCPAKAGNDGGASAIPPARPGRWARDRACAPSMLGAAVAGVSGGDRTSDLDPHQLRTSPLRADCAHRLE